MPVVHDLAPLVYPQYMRWRDYIYYRVFQVRMIKRATHVFTVSEFSKKEIIKHTGIDSEKISVAYNGLHSAFTTHKTELEELSAFDIKTPYFIYYGSIHPRKNIYGLIKSFELYRNQGGQAHLVISGRKAWKSNDIDDLLRNSFVSNYITWLPYLEAEHLHGVVRNALALVYISHYEGFGLPVLEAMASGVPVITSSDSSMSEIGENAVLTCHPLDHSDVASNMLAISTNQVLRQQLITRGLAQSSKFSYKESSQKILKIMKSVIN